MSMGQVKPVILTTRKPRPHQAWFSHHSCTTVSRRNPGVVTAGWGLGRRRVTSGQERRPIF